MVPSLSNSTPMNLLSARDRLHLEQEKRATARLQRQRQREQERRQSEQTKAKQARLDRRPVHDEESCVAFSRPIGMELDSERSIVPITEFLKMLHHSSVTYVYSYIPVSACSGFPLQCFTFSSTTIYYGLFAKWVMY